MKHPSILRLATTLGLLLVGIFLAHALWKDYMYSPWTRDGRVRAKVINVAPDVSGIVTELRVVDNQRVHRGDVLFVIDPVRFHVALSQAEAEVSQAQAQAAVTRAEVTRRQSEWDMRRQQASRRASLSGEVITAESRSDYNAQATQAMATYQSALAAHKAAEANVSASLVGLDNARLNLERSTVRSPVEGFVTNLNLYPGDFATSGLARMALIDADSFWVYGYFEETKLSRVKVGDKADIRLMAGGAVIEGHVESIASGIADRDNPTSGNLLADVNPVFTWVRLAQRIPVRIHLERLPEGIHLASGMTCTVTLRQGS